ncbi:uncharacterized protein EI90DRAFT_2205154 [Cantharellus anzutake]|uniref:uncharacterized protein n=1 Tax=Cantharellus anzutake TaxID=1750568 RepID=UPI00190728C1|nr:uncharacterized protein EI90DRAFT_2205154 [Cantharellus anzutake]KAF8325004.1 hypothetical protein EI90DRAFT_2205154 [Cantharellus anzutake]
MSSPPLERRSRNAPILNPFDQLDAASFDSFVTDVAAAIRNALNPSLPPAPIAKSSHVQAIAPSLDVAGSGESVNGRHLVMLDPSSNVTPSPAPSSVVDTEATEEDTFIRQKFQFKHTTYNLPLSSTRSQEFSNTGLQLKDLNQTNDASSNYSRASKTETPKQRSRSPSVIDLVSDSDDEAESAKPTPTSETVPVRQSPYQRATPEGYVGDAAAETEANVSSEGESMKSGSGKDAVYRRPEPQCVW